MDVFATFASRRSKIVFTLYLAICVAVFVAETLHWRQANDPVQLDYACFLMDHGMAPYRDILEMNMPGIYLVNWSVMHILGGGSLAWRLFDLGLMGALAAAILSIAHPYDWFAGVLASALFILYHGRDGAGQQGQRDLIIAVLLLAAYAFLFEALRKHREWPMLAFGICCGIAATIKPTPLPFALLLLVAAGLRLKQLERPIARPALWALLGMAIPSGVVVEFLLAKGSLGAFAHIVRDVFPYYGNLGRLSFPDLLAATATPSLKTLFAIGVAVATLNRRGSDNWERRMLFLGFLFGAASFFGQGKGFTYQRYPMIAFAIVWGSLEIVLALREKSVVRPVAVAGLAFSLVVAPLYVARARTKVWSPVFVDSLSGDLQALGDSSLSGHVQCISMPAECDTTLYQLKLVQSTGQFYDYFLFGSDRQAPVREMRARFWTQLQRNPPEVMVVGSGLYPRGAGYAKLAMWPLFDDYLQEHYTLWTERRFPPSEAGEMGYRIYLEKDFPGWNRASLR